MQVVGSLQSIRRLSLLFCLLILAGSAASSLGHAEDVYDLSFSNMALLYYAEGEQVDVSTYLPYVAYIDQTGEVKAWFFDAFLYTSQPSLQQTSDWANPLFEPGQELDSLDAAVRQAAESLGQVPTKRLLYFAVPAAEGSIEERIERNRRFIDTVRRLWQGKEYKHLKLGGFYWTHEGVRDPVSRSAIEATYEYIDSLEGVEPYEQFDLELLFIPYDYGRPNRPQVTEFAQGKFPVDALWLQPNFLWADRGRGYERQDFDNTALFATGLDVPIEMEYDTGVLEAGWKVGRYYHYLDSGQTFGYMQRPLAYYQDRWGYAEAARDLLPVARQVYEDTFAFSQGFYRPRSILFEMPLPFDRTPADVLASRFRRFGDTLLRQGLWLGRNEGPEEVSHLRLVEPDPNQSYYLIITMTPPRSSDPDAEGVITLRTRDRQDIVIGTYPLDGETATRWYTIPTDLLSQGVPPNPVHFHLTYTIRFSEPVSIEGGWLRSRQHLFTWDRDEAAAWHALDPTSYRAREGWTLPGVRWDGETSSLHWFGLDVAKEYLVGIETSAGARMLRISPEQIAADGSGGMRLSLSAGETVEAIWLHPADEPFLSLFGVQGDSAHKAIGPGVRMVPSYGWHFLGNPVGVSRQLAGWADLQIKVPADGRRYLLRLDWEDIDSATWQLVAGKKETGTVLAEGALEGDGIELKLEEPGTYTLALKGRATLRAGKLVPLD